MAMLVVNLCRVLAVLSVLVGIFIFLQPFVDPMSGASREGGGMFFAAAILVLVLSVIIDLLAKIERGINKSAP